jgi:integrase
MPRPSKGPRLYFRKAIGLWVILDGKLERRTGFAREQESEASGALAQYLASKHKSTVGAHDPKLVLVTDVVDFYLDQKDPGEGADERAKKLYSDTILLTDRLNEWWGTKALSDVRASTCKDYVRHRTGQTNRRGGGKPISAGTARRELEVLRAAIGVYHAEYVLDAVPVVTLPDKSPRRERYLTRREAAEGLLAVLGWRKGADGHFAKAPETGGSRRLIRRRRRHVGRFMILGFYTGTRHTAMVRARWVPSLHEPWVDVERGLFYRRGSQERETDKRQPPVRLPPRLLAHMRRWRRLDIERGITHVVHCDGEPLSSKLRTAWEGMRDDAGLGADVTPHILRHTSATWVMQGGMPTKDAADYLGMTEDVLRAHYYHFHPDFQAEAGDAFENSKRRAR